MTKAEFWAWIERYHAKAIFENVVSKRVVGVYAYIPGADVPGDERMFSPVVPDIWNSTYSVGADGNGDCLARLYPPLEWMDGAPYDW